MPPLHYDQSDTHTVEAFAAVGRNVVNFQRLEQILKHLALLAPICAPSKKLQSELDARKATSERLTLGNAIKKWSEIADHTGPQRGQQPDDEVIVSFGFVLEWNPQKVDQLAAELDSLVEERNRLIHLDLAKIKFEDEVECIALSNRLNAQNDRIIRALEVLGPTLTRMQDMALMLASDEIISEMIGSVNPEPKAKG
jgi:hypothetical protein